MERSTWPENRGEPASSISPVAATLAAPGAVPSKRRRTRPPLRSKVPRRATLAQSSRPSATVSAAMSRSSISGGVSTPEDSPWDRSERPPEESSRASRSSRRVRSVRPSRPSRRSSRPVPESRAAFPPGSISVSTLFAFSTAPRASNLAAIVKGSPVPAGWTGGPTVSLADPSASGMRPRRPASPPTVSSAWKAMRASSSRRGSVSPPPVAFREKAPSAPAALVARWKGLPFTVPSASQGPARVGALRRRFSARTCSCGRSPTRRVAIARRRIRRSSMTMSRRIAVWERGSSSASSETGRVRAACSMRVCTKRTSPLRSGARAISASTARASSIGPSSAPRRSRARRRCGEGSRRTSTAPSLRAPAPIDSARVRSISARCADQSMKGGTASAATRTRTTAPASAVRKSRTVFASAWPAGRRFPFASHARFDG